MPYLKCTEELYPLGFQTHTFRVVFVRVRVTAAPLIHQYMCFQFIWSKAHDRTAVFNKCVVCVCVWFGGFLLQDVGHASFFGAMCTYSLNEIVFFNFDEQAVDKSIYCCVEEYCAVFWSAPSVSVYFSCSCECACVVILRDSDIVRVGWPQSL